MDEAQQKLLDIPKQEINEDENANCESSGSNCYIPQHNWWSTQVAIYSCITLIGEVVTPILVSTYYARGGKSIWLASFVQNAGFPILVPLLYYASHKNDNHIEVLIVKRKEEPHACVISLVYVVLGVLLAGVSLFNSTALKFIHVSTYSITAATRLGFCTILFFFLGAQNITPSILNSLFLVIVSSVTLVIHNNESNETNFLLGFLSTIGGSVAYSVLLCSKEFFFRRMLKGRNFIDIMEVSIYQALVASIVILFGLFASGDWRNLTMEMEDYKLGKLCYLVILIVIALLCQLNVVASTGLVFQVTSLFSSFLNNLGTSIITPVFAVIFLHDEMKGLKLLSLFLASWGFVSYIYQQYLNNLDQDDVDFSDTCEVSHS